jgi:hypothetical protein
MRTKCGIPWIELQGTLKDWESLRARAAKMGLLMVPSFGTKWMEVLLPVLDEFVAAYRGNVNHAFWQSMVKRIEHGFGSGSYSTISGWINVFYPYLEADVNPFLEPWEQLIQSDGPEPGDFPRVISSAPVEWDYNGDLIKLHFHAGMMGTIQDPKTLALRSRVGWAVTHDPPQSPKERIPELEKQISDIKAAGDTDWSTKYWIKRAENELAALKEGKPIRN